MPIFDPSNWPLVKELRENEAGLKKEFLAARHMVTAKSNPITTLGTNLFDGDVGIFEIVMDKTLWAKSEIKNAGKFSHLRYERNQKICPKMWEIVKRHKEIRQLFWSPMRPNAAINRHIGVGGIAHGKKANHLRMQICWFPGKDCWFHLDDSKIEYKEGTAFAFHDGMEFHWVENLGNEERTTLIIDVWRHLVPSEFLTHSEVIFK